MQGEEAEYLHFDPKIEIPKYQELVKSSKVISPRLLILLLEDAYKYLTQTPGKNATMRQLYAVSWLEW